MAGVEVRGVELRGPAGERFDEVLTPDALELVASLHREFDAARRQLLQKRLERQAELDAGGTLDFPESTRELREGDWRIAPEPDDLADRRVEITGPTSRRWWSTPSIPARRASWRISRTRTRRPGRTWSEGRSISAMRSGARSSTTRRESTTSSAMRWPHCSCARAAGICPSATCWWTASPWP